MQTIFPPQTQRVGQEGSSARQQRTPFVEADGMPVPAAPTSPEATGLDIEHLKGLTLKLAYSVARFTTSWAAERLGLPMPLVASVVEAMEKDSLLQVLGRPGLLNHDLAITKLGREHAVRHYEISGYVGPAPVTLSAYRQMIEEQFRRLPHPDPSDVATALSDLVLSARIRDVVGYAVQSRRSLLVHGPPGNGKTSIGCRAHQAVEGCLWIPYAIAVDQQVMRVFDPGCHHAEALPSSADTQVDRRWIRVRRPFVVVGGELNLESLDLAYNRRLGFYETPLHRERAVKCTLWWGRF